MGADELQALCAALKARWPGVDFNAAPFDGGTRLGVSAQLSDGRRLAAATPDTMDWRALSMPEWLHRFSEALAPRLS